MPGQPLHHVHLPTSAARPATDSGDVHSTAYVGALLPSAVLKEHGRLVERQLSAEHVPVAPRPQRRTPAQHHPHSAPASLVTVRKFPALTDPYATAAVFCCCCDMCDRGSSQAPVERLMVAEMYHNAGCSASAKIESVILRAALHYLDKYLLC
jgi:hypothetical protein